MNEYFTSNRRVEQFLFAHFMEDAAGEVAAMFGGTWSYPAVSAAAATVDFEYGDEEE